MLNFRFRLLLASMLLSLNVFAQQQTIIPFKLTAYNNISVQAILNEKDTVNLMFHTAASALTLTEDALKRISSLNFNRTDSVKSWGGADNTSRYSQSNTVQIGNLTWKQVPIWENKNSGQETDGKFGFELFENKTIEIDFDKKVIIVLANVPPKAKTYQKLELAYENEMMFITADALIGNHTLKNKYLLHSGYPGAVLLDDQFVADHKIGQTLPIVDEKQLKDSFGNILKTKKAVLPGFVIGSQHLDHVPVGFFEGALGRQKMSILGGDILKRFNIIIDAKREFIYLKPNKLKNAAYSNV